MKKNTTFVLRITRIVGFSEQKQTKLKPKSVTILTKNYNFNRFLTKT